MFEDPEHRVVVSYHSRLRLLTNLLLAVILGLIHDFAAGRQNTKISGNLKQRSYGKIIKAIHPDSNVTSCASVIKVSKQLLDFVID